MSALKYSFGLLPALLSFLAIWAGGWWSFSPPIVIFGIMPILDLLVDGSTENIDDEQYKTMRKERAYDFVLYTAVVLQYLLLFYFLYRVAFTPVVWWEVIGMTLSMGMCCGILGINGGHELGHRRKLSEQRMAHALLLTSLYTHFYIEHNRGHHATVGTDQDPASARYGEWLWTFIPRSAFGGYFSAWALERDRLARKNRVWTWDNQMIRFTVLQLAFTAAIFLIFGWVAGLAFIGAAVVGGALLETVNYLEHYGLERTIRDNGSPIPVEHIHSWNSNHPLGRYFLFELSRHSDHHAHARRAYQTLRHFDDSPQLPTGYPGMMVVAWIPPLWFWMVHRHMRQERERVLAMGGETAISPRVERTRVTARMATNE